jgi:hypothetical protein
MNNFPLFAAQVEKQFTEMSKGELYTVNIAGDAVYFHYLNQFPEGTNPIYRERTEHDCSCCKNFIRNIGNVVSIVNGKLVSVWDIPNAEYPYNEVAEDLAHAVKTSAISGLFRTKERKYGAEHTFEQQGEKSVKWNHFHCTINAKHFSATPEAAKGQYASNVQVFSRGLSTITDDALVAVTDLIKSNAIYRGTEFLPLVNDFYSAWKMAKQAISFDAFVWENAGKYFATIRNTVIGTLLVDLSEGVDTEVAVRSYEQKVAPANYKRPTALITKGMVDQAMKTIRDLGIEQSLERRYAKLSDLSVNNVIWVNNSVQHLMKDGIESLLLNEVKQDHSKVKPVEIGITDFIETVLPNASSMSVLFAGSLQSNLMSMTAPAHEDCPSLFKWDNGFGWCYKGNITDSIKEKVKQAGGNVDAKLRFSLAWYNYDDLDIHVIEPDGTHIYFANKKGKLDIDMNAGGHRSREAVENVSYTHPKDGNYLIKVNQFSKRETSNIGFSIEIDSNGSLCHLAYPKDVKGTIDVARVRVVNGGIASITSHPEMIGSLPSKEVWGIATENFIDVNTLTFSPNHWDDNSVGNKHYFFILDGCKSDEPARGIYNEFLKADLDKHRKVFEVLGNKTKCALTDDQLSGLGFSSTKQDAVVVKVIAASSTKQYKVKF